MDAGKIAAARGELARAEKASGTKQQEALTRLVVRLEADVAGAGDTAKVRMLAQSVRGLTAEFGLAQR
jgi:hypothetical protein